MYASLWAALSSLNDLAAPIQERYCTVRHHCVLRLPPRTAGAATRTAPPRASCAPVPETRVALTQKLRRLIEETVGYGLAREGISAADVARGQATDGARPS